MLPNNVLDFHIRGRVYCCFRSFVLISADINVVGLEEWCGDGSNIIAKTTLLSHR